LSSGNTGNDPLILNTGGGNVGIGTSAPVRKLETSADNNAGSKANYIRITDTDTSASANNPQGGIEFYTNDVGNEGVTASIENIYAGSGAGSELTFNVAPNGSAGVSEAMRIDASGNVGIGTDAPAQLLSVGDSDVVSTNYIRMNQRTGTAAATYGGLEFFYDNTAGVTGVNAAIRYASGAARNDGELTFHTGSSGSTSEAMRIDASGNLLVGTTSAGALASPGRGLIDINGSSDSALEFKTAGVTHGYLYESGSEFRVANLTAHPLTFYTSNNERMRIDASGNLLVGRTSTASAATDYGTQVYSNGVIYQFAGATGNSDIHRWHNGAGTKVAYLQGDGDLIITGTYSPSDERLKENIVDAPAGNLDDLRVRSYDWKADGSSVTHGFIAQELEVVAPYAVTKGETDDDMLAVDYSKLVPMMVKEIQDLKAEVAALKGA
jgi:hypothetical protein